MCDYIKYKCPICGAEYQCDTAKCLICGWREDKKQENNPYLEHGLNPISFNNYKRVLYLNLDSIIGSRDATQIIKEFYFKEPNKYDRISNEELDVIIDKCKIKAEAYPHKCKVCGLGQIREEFDICNVCTWEDNELQNTNKDFAGYANKMSFNQYKMFWLENKNEILKNSKTNPMHIYELKKFFEKKL